MQGSDADGESWADASPERSHLHDDERRRCRTCGEALPLGAFWRIQGRPAPDCKACAAARQRAYAKTAQGRQVVRDAQRRYRARRRGARPNEPGLRRLVADEVRLAARSAGTAELAVAPHLWQMLGSPPWVDLERVTPNRVDVTAGEDYPAADGPGAPRIALTAAACRALRLAPGRYPASHEPGRLVIALPAGTWPEPPPKPVPDDPPELLIQPPYYLAMTRAAYEALGSPAHLQLRRGRPRGRIEARACSPEDPDALQVQRAEGRHPRVSAGAFFRRAGIDAAAMRGAYLATVGRGRVVAELPAGDP